MAITLYHSYLQTREMIPNPVESRTEHAVSQNGPSRDLCEESRRNGDDSAQSEVEETRYRGCELECNSDVKMVAVLRVFVFPFECASCRAKALEACEQYTAAVGLAPNGPV